MQIIRTCVAAAAALAAVSVHAQSDDRPLLATSRDNWPTEITRRPLTLGEGMFEVVAPLSANASEGADLQPWLLGPSLYVGITDQWMLGVRHLAGICLGDKDEDCGGQNYNDVSVDSVFSIGKGGGLDMAVGLSLNYAPIDPATWGGEARVILRAGGGAFAFTLQPTIHFGLNDRDEKLGAAAETFNLGTYNLIRAVQIPDAANREVLLVPLTVQMQIGPTLAIAAGAAVEGAINPEDDTRDFGDAYRIPVQAAVVLTPIPWIDVGASLTFTNAFGKETPEEDRFDSRWFTVFGAFRL